MQTVQAPPAKPVSGLAGKLNIAETVLAFLGSGVAGTLWWAHSHRVDLPCTNDGGCDIVAASKWAHVTLAGQTFDVALMGFLGYLALLTLGMAKAGADNPVMAGRLHWLVWLISAGGAAYSIYLQYVAHWVLHAFCPWCFTSASIMTILFLVACAETKARSGVNSL